MFCFEWTFYSKRKHGHVVVVFPQLKYYETDPTLLSAIWKSREYIKGSAAIGARQQEKKKSYLLFVADSLVRESEMVFTILNMRPNNTEKLISQFFGLIFQFSDMLYNYEDKCINFC